MAPATFTANAVSPEDMVPTCMRPERIASIAAALEYTS